MVSNVHIFLKCKWQLGTPRPLAFFNASHRLFVSHEFKGHIVTQSCLLQLVIFWGCINLLILNDMLEIEVYIHIYITCQHNKMCISVKLIYNTIHLDHLKSHIAGLIIDLAQIKVNATTFPFETPEHKLNSRNVDEQLKNLSTTS